ncbi:MAG: HAD family hydrolase [Ilumatobacter sp.]|nr:HAD family hydrolase [Ilumatobacter sp.]
MSASTVVAAFDFDGTLTRRDSVVPFLRRFSSRRRFARRLLRHTLRVLPMAARQQRDELRAVASQLVFAGLPIDRVAAQAELHGSWLAAEGLRRDTVDRLAWHVDQGHRVVIVSASYEHYVRVVAEQLGGPDVLATRLEVVDGLCTGRLDGANCRGPEKVRRLEEWLAGLGLDRSEVTVHAYGDSAGDDEMLAWADHPHRVVGPLDSVAPTV